MTPPFTDGYFLIIPCYNLMITCCCQVQRTLDHNLAAIYGKKLFSKRKRDAVKFQQLSDLMRTLMYSMKITPKYVWDSCVLAYICYEMDQ